MKIRKKHILILALFLFLGLLSISDKLIDEFWFREYTYVLDGFYEDDYYSDSIKAANFDGTYTIDELIKNKIEIKNGHYILIKDEDNNNVTNIQFRLKLNNRHVNGQTIGIGYVNDDIYYTLYRNSIKKYLNLQCIIPQSNEKKLYIFNYSADPISFTDLSIKYY